MESYRVCHAIRSQLSETGLCTHTRIREQLPWIQVQSCLSNMASGKTRVQSAAALCVQTALCGLHVVQRDGLGAAGELRVRRIVGVQPVTSRLPRAVACRGNERLRVYLASAIRP